jgi:uncharacterized protein (DUF697 family)
MKKNPDQIIREHVAFSMVAGAIPFPVVDIAAVTAIQLDMLKQIADRYEVDFNRERGKSLASALFSATVGSLVGRTGASMVKVIPGIGTILGIGSQIVLAGTTTYALGKVFDQHFNKRGTLDNFDVEEMKESFQDYLKKGKGIAQEMKDTTGKEDVLKTIEKLDTLRKSGAITEREFEKTKKELLGRLKDVK